jgi:hypothetical protein
MLRNPLRAYAQRRTSRMLTRVGWEPPQTWPVPRPGRAPLVFQTRLPKAEFVQPDDLPAGQRDTPASVGGDAIPLREAAQVEGVFLAVALCSHARSEDVLATMTAALTPKPLAFLDRAGAVQGRRARRKIKHIAGKVTVIERRDGDPPPADPPRVDPDPAPPPVDPDAAPPEPPPLTVQYAVRTRFGTLTLTFRGEGHGIAEDFGRRLFLDVVRGCYLGNRPLVPTDA